MKPFKSKFTLQSGKNPLPCEKTLIYALLAAAFYAINVPFSKLLLNHVGTATMAALLYLGAGIGIGIMSLFNRREKSARLDRKDLPFVIGMIVLDIAAPVFFDDGDPLWFFI